MVCPLAETPSARMGKAMKRILHRSRLCQIISPAFFLSVPGESGKTLQFWPQCKIWGFGKSVSHLVLSLANAVFQRPVSILYSANHWKLLYLECSTGLNSFPIVVDPAMIPPTCLSPPQSFSLSLSILPRYCTALL